MPPKKNAKPVKKNKEKPKPEKKVEQKPEPKAEPSPESTTEQESETKTKETTTEELNEIVNVQVSAKTNIFKSNAEPAYSKNIDFPAIYLGFQHYIHQNYTKKEVFKQFETRKKVYLVLNELEVNIDNYEGIEQQAEKYFKTKIVSKGFYKLWEMAHLHKFLDIKSNITTLHINDKNGGFAQATMLYRNNTKDTYNASFTNDTNILDKEITKKVNILKKPDIKADFITAYGEDSWKYDYTAESEAFLLLLNELLLAVSNQKNGGTFVCKIFETFTNTTCKMIEMLTQFYDKVYIVKPMTSRTYSYEKFLVCTGFTHNKDNVKKLEEIISSNKNKLNLVNIFPEYTLDKKFAETMTQTNIKLSNAQYECLNKMFTYIEKQNFFGDEYHQRIKIQIKNSEDWVVKYLK